MIGNFNFVNYSFLVFVSCKLIILSTDNSSFLGLNHKSFITSPKPVITKPVREKTRVWKECLAALVKGIRGQIKPNKEINHPIIFTTLKIIIHLLVLLSLSQ